MVRSAAKNYHDVTIVVDQADYDEVLAQIKEDGETSLATRARLAAKAFRHTPKYLPHNTKPPEPKPDRKSVV